MKVVYHEDYNQVYASDPASAEEELRGKSILLPLWRQRGRIFSGRTRRNILDPDSIIMKRIGGAC
jgi:hypothetical protein